MKTLVSLEDLIHKKVMKDLSVFFAGVPAESGGTNIKTSYVSGHMLCHLIDQYWMLIFIR